MAAPELDKMAEKKEQVNPDRMSVIFEKSPRFLVPPFLRHKGVYLNKKYSA